MSSVQAWGWREEASRYAIICKTETSQTLQRRLWLPISNITVGAPRLPAHGTEPHAA